MGNLQLYFAAGLPTIAVLIGILVNRLDVSALRTELSAIRVEMRNEMSSCVRILISRLPSCDLRSISALTS
jgi:hypothetical protein